MGILREIMRAIFTRKIEKENSSENEFSLSSSTATASKQFLYSNGTDGISVVENVSTAGSTFSEVDLLPNGTFAKKEINKELTKDNAKLEQQFNENLQKLEASKKANYKNSAVKNPRVNKSELVFIHLEEKGTIDTWTAIQKYGATRLSAIIYNLRKRGYDIATIPSTVLDRNQNICNYATYKYTKNGLD